MTTHHSTQARACFDLRGYLLMEALVYIGVVMVILGAGYAALYRCVDHSMVLQRNAQDIANALQAGERWRADVRIANMEPTLQNARDEQIFHLQGGQHSVDYRYSNSSVHRRVDSGPWTRVLDRVAKSNIESDPREKVHAWRWELELSPQTKGSVRTGRVKPLFTFLSVPMTSTKQ